MAGRITKASGAESSFRTGVAGGQTTALFSHSTNKLAEKVSLGACTDPVFGKLKTLLNNWFRREALDE